MAVDGSGNIYISDDNNSAVYLETLSGGSYTQSVVANNANGINSPYGLAVNANGSVYICDYGNNHVWLETPSGGGNYTQSQIPTSSLNRPLMWRWMPMGTFTSPITGIVVY